jgi:hypothetical protein
MDSTHSVSIQKDSIRAICIFEGPAPCCARSRQAIDAYVFVDNDPRPVVDRQVLAFVQAHTFHSADFTVRSDGVCRINPQMVSQIVSLFSGGVANRNYALAHGNNLIKALTERNNNRENIYPDGNI